MKLHFPSFALGVAAGAGGAALAPRLRPIALELATMGYRIADAALLRVARGREDVSDLLAEARARARALRRRAGRGGGPGAGPAGGPGGGLDLGREPAPVGMAS